MGFFKGIVVGVSSVIGAVIVVATVCTINEKKKEHQERKYEYYGFSPSQLAVLSAAVCILPEEVSSGKVSIAKHFRDLYDADPDGFQERFKFRPMDMDDTEKAE